MLCGGARYVNGVFGGPRGPSGNEAKHGSSGGRATRERAAVQCGKLDGEDERQRLYSSRVWRILHHGKHNWASCSGAE